MAAIKLSIVPVALSLLSACFANASECDEQEQKIRDILLRSMRQSRSINVIAVVVQHQGGSEWQRVKVKIEQCRTGKQTKTVLQPLAMQGMMMVDDGRRAFTYLPDDRTFIESPSGLAMLEDAAERMALAHQNYSMAMKRSQPVAGRPTLQIIATPHTKGLPERHFYLDEKTLFLLKMATESLSGERRVFLDTKVVTYPQHVSEERFELIGSQNARRIRSSTPTPLEAIANLPDRLGFAPVRPTRLPMGFQVLDAQYRLAEEGRSVAMTLSDGLAAAMLYQYKCSATSDGFEESGRRTTITRNGVSFMLVSDLPSAARLRLLESFAKRPKPSSKARLEAPVFTGNGSSKALPLPTREPQGSSITFSLQILEDMDWFMDPDPLPLDPISIPGMSSTKKE